MVVTVAMRGANLVLTVVVPDGVTVVHAGDGGNALNKVVARFGTIDVDGLVVEDGPPCLPTPVSVGDAVAEDDPRTARMAGGTLVGAALGGRTFGGSKDATRFALDLTPSS
ncbi:hypothetical protein [uncultured Williamsia sp.]|uniref:hypothetical protein n=1 Tax=uncultured Williamsia sp. TaxID=259311 RepID=UPI00262033E9|nr:hypothetical protein [uncultured Williamsia sp.]